MIVGSTVSASSMRTSAICMNIVTLLGSAWPVSHLVPDTGDNAVGCRRPRTALVREGSP